MLPSISPVRIRSSHAPLQQGGQFVLYWMTAARRTRASHALQHAVRMSQELGKPLVVLEGIRVDARWSCERVHRFVMQGMADNARRFHEAGVAYLPYVEPEPGHGKGLLEALAQHACVVVTDAFPSHFLPRMVATAEQRLRVRLDVVDGNGVIPLDLPDRDFTVAHSFRRWIQKNIGSAWDPPVRDPLVDLPGGAVIDSGILERWQPLGGGMPTGQEACPASLAGTPGVIAETGGALAAAAQWSGFLEQRLHRYHEDRSHPDDGVQSGMSAYLHFGHIGVHEMLVDVLGDWDPAAAPKATGKREGWWGLAEPQEALLDELITWRELGYVQAHREGEAFSRYDGLPAWALKTLDDHRDDPREHLYSFAELEHSQTDDPLWNAAQRELVQEGRIHNALRMLWGKKVLGWTSSPEQAFAFLVELNNRYAIDGRNPNSYSGIGWVCGRFDRAWGPERPIYGKVRYMTTASSMRKWRVREYMERFRPR